jgi:hypothetical protein
MAKIWRGLLLFLEKRNRENWRSVLNELEYQNIEGFEFKDLPKGNTANNYGQYQGSMSNRQSL